MSTASLLLCFAFLGFFLFLMPLLLYLFARRFPDKYPSFIGFPDDAARPRDFGDNARGDDPASRLNV